MYEETVGSSVGMAEFDMTCEHGTSFCGFGLSIIVFESNSS